MRGSIANESIAQLFTEARTHHVWKDQPITDQQLANIYELTKWGPTSVNGGPARIIYIKSQAEKEKLLPALLGSNIEQVKQAPVTAILAYDEKWLDNIEKLFPVMNVKPYFEGNAPLLHETAFRNSSMQGAYMIMAIRSLGMDACPMSGFNNAAVDETFLKGTSWKSNFICTIGYGEESKLYPRSPRLSFEEACRII